MRKKRCLHAFTKQSFIVKQTDSFNSSTIYINIFDTMTGVHNYVLTLFSNKSRTLVSQLLTTCTHLPSKCKASWY